MFLYVVRSDAKLLEHKLNITLVPWILELNSIKEKCKVRLSLKEDIDVDKLLDLIDKGFPVSRSAIYERYGVPAPKDEKDVFVKPDMGVAFSSEKLSLNFSNNYENLFGDL
jgi:phage gp29-like protein